MKRLYSVVARASQEVVMADLGVVLQSGANVFTVVTADIDEVLERLKRAGADVHTVRTITPDPEESTGR